MSDSTNAPTQARKTWQQLANEMEETAGGFWKPEQPGDAIGVRLTDIERNTGKQGTSTIYTGEDESGAQVSFWGSAILDRKLKDANLGDLVMVKYLGWQESKNGNSYKSFAVKVLKDEVPF